jgi:phenylalanyl-tRNA synthetase alpha chain
MEEQLIAIKNEASSLILGAENLEELNQIKLDYMGKSGKLTSALKEITKLPPEERPEIGRLANEIKNTVEDLIKEKEKSLSLKKTEEKKKEFLDVTMPGVRPPLGHLHLITQAIKEITDIFETIGFKRERHPEVEFDWYAFEALNFPENHPARDEWETFFIDQTPDPKKGPIVLTPHTSSGQIRQLEKGQLPIRMLNIAKCYRRQSDVSHTAMFHQFETLCVGENISIANLKGTLEYFAKSYFGEKRTTRIRPYQFQFTEPSFEVDISCGICDGKGCKLCKEGWLELGGAGMVHPNVLKHGGLDPNKYSGFASGFGVERVLMMKEGLEIDDLRLLYSNNLEFLQQF